MSAFPVFLSVVIIVRNQAAEVRALAESLGAPLAALASDYELILVDNASSDASLEVYRELVGESGLPNLQIFALTKEVDSDTAYTVGLENALGDFIAFVDPATDDATFLREMLERAVSGADVVFAANRLRPRQSAAYRASSRLFNSVYARMTGVDLERNAPPFRVLSRKVANFILQHPLPAVAYRHLPAAGGFSKANLDYSAPPSAARAKRLGDSFERGVRLLVSTTRAPMRLVTALSLFGAVSNIVYSGYVIAVALMKQDVAPGWVTLSLQQSGMFFLISLVLLVLGEYIIHMASLSSAGPRYHVAQEFTSARITGRARLNVEEARGEAARARVA